MKSKVENILYTIVGDANLHVVGQIYSTSNIAVSGEIKGDIDVDGNCILITKDCKVIGNVKGGKVTIEGEINGGITASNVHIASSGIVNGPIVTVIISVDEGGELNGSCTTQSAADSDEDQKNPS